MPFPFDNQRTLGIFGVDISTTRSSILPFVPKQDNQWSPPPPPLEIVIPDINDKTYEEIVEAFLEWYDNNIHGPFASAFDIWYNQWRNNRLGTTPDEPKGETTNIPLSQGGGRTPIPPYIFIRGGFNKHKKYKKRFVTEEVEKEILKEILRNKMRREEERKGLCEEFKKKFGYFSFVPDQECLNNKGLGDADDFLNIDSKEEWRDWVKYNSTSTLSDWVDAIPESAGAVMFVISSMFPTGFVAKAFGALGGIAAFKGALNYLHEAWLSITIDYWDRISTNYNDFRKFQAILREYYTLTSIECTLKKAQDFLNEHGLYEFPCEEERNVYNSLLQQYANSLKRYIDNIILYQNGSLYGDME